MSRVAESRGRLVLLVGLGVMSASCGAGQISGGDAGVEQGNSPTNDGEGQDGSSPSDPSGYGIDGATGLNDTDGGSSTTGEPAADAASDASTCSGADGSSTCDCTTDSDEDGTDDCHDECPLDRNSAVLLEWYADCDGDGAGAAVPVLACAGEFRKVTCQDGAAPDGGWSATPGADCNDEDPTAVAVRDFYPDCDNDGLASVVATSACGVRAASAAFDCKDGKDPDGGFRTVQGSDCADEDASKWEPSDWYPDCDGDRAATSVPVHACGIRGANETFKCADGNAPDGGFWSMPGIDCNDEDGTIAEARDWFADCDGDRTPSSTPTHACGLSGASAMISCKDGSAPDGGFSSTPGNDCNDEDPSAAAKSDWFADCDGDGKPRASALSACGLAGASVAFDCTDGKDPDGGFASKPGSDCNDEDASLTAPTDWFADCDGDGAASSVPISACGSGGASTVFQCADGQAPDGGFSSTGGTDCNDEDASVVATSAWYADCDGDGVHTSTAIQACGLAGTAASSPCADHQAPDGGFDSAPGDDCDDELSTNPCRCGFQDDDGDGICAPSTSLPRSCLEAHDRDPAAGDGEYEIDPDGAGSTSSFIVTCDMTGGGFTVIARDEFTSGDSAGWQAADGTPTPVDTTSNCMTPLGAILGGYGVLGGSGAQTSKTFSLLSIPHTEVSVALDYIVFDSWDGEDALVYVDGVEGYRAAFLGSTASKNICGSARRDHGPQRVDVLTAHSQDSVAVRVTSTLNQVPTDESFAVDNVLIRIR